MNPLCIVPCGRRKIWDIDPVAGPTCAKDVYVGPFASKCRAYAEHFHPSAWCIVSAKYGLLFPDDLVPGPYNTTFNDRSTEPIGLDDLSHQVRDRGIHNHCPVIVLGGREYVLLVEKALAGTTVVAPLSGCRGIGYMMQRLDQAIRDGKPL